MNKVERKNIEVSPKIRLIKLQYLSMTLEIIALHSRREEIGSEKSSWA